MSNYEEKVKNLATKLFEINAFKFGDFKMKVGINSPVYFDLRVIVSHPEIMEEVSALMHDFITEKKLAFKHYCGVPYTALPIASILSVQAKVPMLIRRKEAKAYGTKRLIEGKYEAGDVCLIIEDVVTSGSSIMETVVDLRGEGIVVKDAIVVVDREQGGVENINNNGVKMHSLFTLSFLLKTLQEAGKITQSTVDAVSKYIAACQIRTDGSFFDKSTVIVNKLDRTKMPFADRIDLAKNDVTKTLFKIMDHKKTNLCVAADLTDADKILDLAEQVGEHICILKTHVDIINDFSENFIKKLKSISAKHNFLLMEDRKFADIGNTVSQQYNDGIFKISSWADLVTVHSIAGQSIIQGLQKGLKTTEDRGVVLLAEMSSKGNFITAKYTEDTMNLAKNTNIEFISGIVCQNEGVVTVPGLIQMTPGVKIDESNDNLGQQYNTPEMVIKERGADIGIVGRGILEAKHVESAAELYRKRLWAAYEERISKD